MIDFDDSIEIDGSVDGTIHIHHCSTPLKGTPDEPLDLSIMSAIVEEEPSGTDDNNNYCSDDLHLSCAEINIETEAKYMCQICHYSSKYKHNLKRHSKIHREEKTPSLPDYPTSAARHSKNGTTQNLTCEVCNYETTKKSNLLRHMPIHKARREEKSVYICETCGKELHSKYAHTLHIKSLHENIFKYKCPTCNRGFNQKHHFKGHLASHHRILRLKCDLCPSTFSYQLSLQDHVKSVHDVTRLSCPDSTCKSVFSSNRALLEHTRAEHDRLRLTCDKCDKTFKWRSSLKYHRSHAHL